MEYDISAARLTWILRTYNFYADEYVLEDTRWRVVIGFCYFEINWLPVLGFMVGDGGGTLELFLLILQLYVSLLPLPTR